MKLKQLKILKQSLDDNLKKLISQSAILTIGTIIYSVSLFLFRIVFYQKSTQFAYSQFLAVYSLFLSYRILGYMNIGPPFSNDVNISKKNKEKIPEYLMNTLSIILIFSLISDLLMSINLILIGIKWEIIIIFCFTMIIFNFNRIFIPFYRGLEKVTNASILVIINGILKPIILLTVSYITNLSALYISLTFLVSEILSLLISLIFFLVWFRKEKLALTDFKLNFSIFKTYIKHCFNLVIIGLCYQGFFSLVYLFTRLFISEDILGYIDVPITCLTFLLYFFQNIGLMLAVNNINFEKRDNYIKSMFWIVISSLILLVIYLPLAYFLSVDDWILEKVFNLDGGTLATGVIIILISLPFFVIYTLINGYKQGFREYKGLLISSIISILFSAISAYFLINYYGITGALWSLVVFAVLLAISSLVILRNKNQDENIFSQDDDVLTQSIDNV